VALEAMGERWSFMILRAALNGVRHFEDFLDELGIAGTSFRTACQGWSKRAFSSASIAPTIAAASNTG
jgi:hypothetical protein